MLLLLLLQISIKGNAQRHSPFGDVSIASPTAASLGKFEDLKVNYHTGSPQINIPIYEIESGPLKMSIELNYHPSGLKVMEPASWAGAGWALQAGGVITRTVMGAPDEKNTSNVGSEYGHFTNYGYNSYLYTGDMQDWAAFAEGRKDGEPDLFFFNFNGYSGKFYFADDRLPIFVPQQDLRIEYNYSGTGSISSFIITVPDGTKYYFGATINTTDTDPIEITNPMTIDNGFGYSTTISSWFLNKIESEDGVFSINLNYLSENYSYFTWSMFPLSKFSPSYKKEYSLTKMFQSGVRLDKITFANGHVDFIPGAIRTDLGGQLHDFTDDANTSAKTLGAISINNDKGFCKKWQLYYNYFEDNGTGIQTDISAINTDRKRLRLDSIQESSCNASIIIPAYKFDYYTEQVPRRLSFGVDHWGFNNGIANGTLIPTYNVNDQPVYGANRESAWPAMRAGAMRKITYPMGGATDFEFGPHRASISFTRDSWTYFANFSIGYDGSNPIVTSQMITLQAGTYTANLSSSDRGSDAGFSAMNVSSNQTIISISASSSIPEKRYKEQTAYFEAGTYKLTLIKDNSNAGGTMTGVGATVSLTQSVPVTVTIDTIVGGLRINKITAHESISENDKVTTFSYTAGGKSSGVLFSRPTYVQLVRNDMIKDLGYWNPSTGYVQSCSPDGCISCIGFPYYISPNSIRPMGTTQGGHFGYNEVKVTEVGNGYSIYKYYTDMPYGPVPDNVAILSVKTDYCGPNTANFPPAPLPFDNLRGELKEEEHYREDGKLLKDRIYNYSFSASTETTPAFIASYFNTSASNIILGTQYSLYSSKKLQSVVTENNLDQLTNNYISTVITNDFSSPNHNEATTTQTINSVGDAVLTKSKYAFDFRTNCDATIDCTPVYTTACNSCWTVYQSEASACGSTPYCRTNAYLKYEKCLAQARVTLINCRRTNYTDPTNTFKTCLQTAVNNAGPELKPILTLQQTFNNSPIEVSSWKNGKLIKAAFSRFDFVTDPTGKVAPNKYQLINLASPSSSFIAANTSGTTIIKDEKYQDEKSIKYEKGNLVQTLGRDGMPRSYIYDYQNDLPIAVVTNAATTQIAYTSFEAEGGGYWSFSGTVVTDNTSPTGVKCYNIGTGAISRSGLNTTTLYIVSYWTKNTVPYSITGTQGTAIKGRTANGWTYYEHKVSGNVIVTVTGAGMIDELKLFPQDAQVRTFTYSPLVGITSESDFKDQITYYFYDDMGRLRLIKDMNGNIRKVICYNNNGQIENCGGIL